MFARTLAKTVAVLPSGMKYKTKALRRFYIFLMSLGQPVISVRTRAGTVLWRIDRMTCQRHVLGSYELYMQDAFLRFVRIGSVVYDIGAHASFHSLFCGQLVGSSGRVLAFEPDPEARRSIERQLALNPGIPVSVYPYAISDHCGFVRLDTSRGTAFVSQAGDVSVESKTIDGLVRKGVISPPDLIKIDVEGHECNVLRGAMGVLGKHRPIILCDPNDGQTSSAVAGLLTPLGYGVSEGLPIIALPNSTKA
jgi:FkbM family methyltransferase